jgi:hypothetical protein
VAASWRQGSVGDLEGGTGGGGQGGGGRGTPERWADDEAAQMASGGSVQWWRELARRTPGWWGKRVRRSGVDGQDERQGGDRPMGGGSLLKGAGGGGEEVGDSRERWGTPHGAGRAWGLATTSRRRPGRPWPGRDAPLFRSGTPMRLTRGPRLAMREGVRSGARGVRGPARRNAEWAKPDEQ